MGYGYNFFGVVHLCAWLCEIYAIKKYPPSILDYDKIISYRFETEIGKSREKKHNTFCRTMTEAELLLKKTV